MRKEFKNGWKKAFNPALITKGVKFNYDLVDAKSGKVVLEKGAKLSPRAAKKLAEEGLKEIYMTNEAFAEAGLYLSDDILDEETFEVIADSYAGSTIGGTLSSRQAVCADVLKEI